LFEGLTVEEALEFLMRYPLNMDIDLFSGNPSSSQISSLVWLAALADASDGGLPV